MYNIVVKKLSSRSLSHLLMSFLFYDYDDDDDYYYYYYCYC